MELKIMDFKSFKFKVLNGSIARLVLLRCFVIALALSVITLLQILCSSDPVMFNTVTSNGFTGISGYSNTYMFLDGFIYPIMGSFHSMQSKENANLTVNVVRELMGLNMLGNDANALCVGEGSASSVYALRELGFEKVCGVYRRPFFFLRHKKFVYKLNYENNFFDFVLSTGLDKVSVPALLVLEIERVLRPGGTGAMLIGVSSSIPNSLIRSANPLSSMLKTSSIMYVDHINEFTLVVFQKRIETVSYFEQFHLPADCQSHVNNKPFMQFLEPLVEEKPLAFEKKTVYLPKFMDAASRKRLVYIDVGAGEYLNSNVKSWFLPSYPVDHKAFNVYFVDHNTSVMLSYVKRPGITFVYHPDLAGSKAKANPDVLKDSDPYPGYEGFDFLLWFKETVLYADFVVLKMNAGEIELKFLTELFKSGTICFVDELFLRCSDHEDTKDSESGSCMDVFKSLRNSGVFVHQWWED